MIRRKYYVTTILIFMVILLAGVISIYTSDAYVDTNVSETVEIVQTGEQYNVAIADTRSERYTGLSNYEDLNDGYGMLFVFNDEDSQTFVMRDMNFGIDIIFINKQCTITDVYSATEPVEDESGTEEEHRYTGVAMYVLEVPYGSTNASVGDKARTPFCP